MDGTEQLHVDLIVPVYNERDNLIQFPERVISPLQEFANDWSFTIYLLVDESDDGSWAACEELAANHVEVQSIKRKNNPGFGNAIKHGFRISDGDVVIPFMADFSDSPEDVAAMVKKLREGHDIVYGSRFSNGGSFEGYPLLKLFYNRVFNHFIRILFGIQQRDITNAFKAYRRAVINEIGVETISSESFDITAELPLLAHVRGFKAAEVGITWRSREEGVSKLDISRKGPYYFLRTFQIFVRGIAGGFRDVFGAMVNQSRYHVLGGLLLGILLITGLSSVIGIDQISAALSDVKPLWLLPVASSYFVSFLFRTWRWRVLLRTGGYFAHRDTVFRCIMTGWFFNFLLPARIGDIVRGLTLKTTEDVPFSVGTGTIVIARMLDMLVLGSASLLLGKVFLDLKESVLLSVVAVGIAAALGLGLGIVYFFEDATAALLDRLFGRGERSVRAVRDSLRGAAANPYGMGLAMLLTVPVWTFEAGTLYFSARSVGLPLGVFETMAAGIAAFLSFALPITPAGIGTYQAAVIGVLSAIGVDPSVATAVSLIDHSVRLVVVLLAGALTTVHIAFKSQAYFRENPNTDLRDVFLE